MDNEQIGNYVQLTAVSNKKDKAKCELLSEMVIKEDKKKYFKNNKTLIYFKNEDINTNSKYHLVECNTEYKKESGESCKLIIANKNYYIGERDNSLIEILRDNDNKIDVNVINKDNVRTGYYLNNDKSAIICINGKGCEEADDKYIKNSCNDEHLGLLIKSSDDDNYLNLCSSVDITESGIYITAINSNTFPESTKGYISLEYSFKKKSFLKVEKNEKCTKDGQVIFSNNAYYYCTHVIIHETYNNNDVIDPKSTIYESIPISLTSVGSSFALNFGTEVDEFKVVHIEDNSKIRIDYGTVI